MKQDLKKELVKRACKGALMFAIQIAILLTIALIIMCSCKSSKSTSTSDYVYTEESNSKQVFDLLTLSKLNIDSWYNSATKAVINFRIYDTSKVDSLGNHPILADGNAIIDNAKEGGSSEQKTDSTEFEAECIQDNTTSEIRNDVTTVEKDATPVLKQSKSLIIWICVLVVLLLIGCIAYSCIKKRK